MTTIPGKILLAICLWHCIGCQPPLVRLHPENTETSMPITEITVERKAEVQNGNQTIWQKLNLEQPSPGGEKGDGGKKGTGVINFWGKRDGG
jgi:hypothetical protein